MNPAPTLLDDWVTNAAFWWFILIAATTGVVWLTASFVKVWRAQDATLSPPPHVINWCDRNGHTYRPTGGWACTHCGHWHLYFAGQDPPGCLVCSDVRNALPDDGWDFATVERVGRELTNFWAEYMPGVRGFSAEPKFGLGATGWLLTRPDGNVAFEAAPFYQPAALDFIESFGGVATLSCSHPHGMGALWQLAEHFKPTVVIHTEGDGADEALERLVALVEGRFGED